MRKEYILGLFQTLLFLIFSSASFAQLTGVKTIPGDYLTIAGAINDLNATGVGAGGVTFDVAANYTETGVMPVITATGTLANPIVFQKSGVGTNPTITAGTGLGSMDGVIILQGTDYITFDGINIEEAAANTTATTQMEWGFALLKTSGTDGSQNVIIKNCRIILSSANVSSVGIYSASHTPTSTLGLTVSNINGTNSYNNFFSNIIVGAYNGIEISGANSASYYDIFNEVGVLGGNTIVNFGGGSSVAKGVYTIYQTDLNIANNNITSNTGTIASVYGIHAGTATSANIDVFNNTITIHGGGTTQTIYAIYNQAGSTPLGNSVEIYNNIIQNCTYPTTSSGSFYAIENSGAAEFVKINGNTISDFTNYAGTGIIYMIYNSVSDPDMNLEINNNTINNITRTGTGSGSTYIIRASTAESIMLNNNNIYDISVSGTGLLRIYNNTVSPALENYNGNNIYNITNNGSGTTAGLYCTSASATISNIANNKFYNFNTNSGTTYGIYKTTGTYSIEKNKIFDLNSNSGEVVGIYTGSGTATVTNNLIGNLDVSQTTSATAVSGIRGAAGSALYLYYNTIYLNATSTTTTAFGTSGIYISGTTTPVLDIRNNIVINKSTSISTGKTVAFRRSTTDNNAILSSCNNNLYYAGTPSSDNVIYFDGTNFYQSVTDYKALVAPREDFSITEDVSFISTIGSSVDFLRIDPAVPSIAESGAQVIIGFEDDYFNTNIRTGYPLTGQINGGGTSPDMGAIEDDYTPKTMIDYGISEFLSPQAGNCYGTNSDIIVELKNYSISTVNLATYNVTIDVTAEDPLSVVTTFSIVVNSGTLTAGETMPVTISSAYNMSALGTYTFTATTNSPSDIDASNDSLVPAYTFTIDNGSVSVNNNAVCSGSPIVLNISGSTGTIQWQSSIDNGSTWVNETGTGSTSLTYNDTTPNTDVLYRALTCGTLISDTAAVSVTYVAPPTSNNVTRCGTGPVTLNASATGNVSWYDAPTGGNQLQTGNTFTTTVASSTTFYAQATDGGSGSDSLTTTFAGGSGCGAGNMFDLTAISTVDINGFTVVPNTTSASHVVNVYYKSGSYVGSINTPGDWTLAGTVTLNVTAAQPIKFNLSTPFTVTAGQVYGIYVEHSAQYTSGANTYSNADISVSLGDGLCASFTSCCNPRTFNGRIHYSSGCNSSRTPVSVTVDPAPAITLTASSIEICEDDSSTLAVSSSNPDYVYTWTPSAGLNTTTGTNVQASPSAITTYTVAAEDPFTGCVISDSVTIDVNPVPIVTATASQTEICEGDSTQLNSNASASQAQFIGTNSTSNSSTTYPAPYGNWYWGAKHQMLITAAEMTTYGYIAGPLTSLSFDVTNTNGSPALNNFTIAIGHTAVTSMTTYQSGLTNVYSAASYTPVTGINTHNFSTPFVWDGVSNIIVETCFNNSSYTYNASFKQTTTSFTSVRYNNSDNSTVCGNTTGNSSSSNRPDMLFGQNIVYTYNWTPSSGLSDPTITDPIASPLTTTIYEVEVTNSNTGCSQKSSVTITVSEQPDITLAVTNNNMCFGDSISSITASLVTPITGTLTYNWSHDINETSNSASGLGAGIYIVEVTTGDGCVEIAQDTITEPTEIVNSFSIVDIDCFGAGNGEATVVSTGGTGAHSYIWNNDPSLTTSTISNLTPGVYEIEVSDANGCTKIDTVTITEPDPLVLSSSVTDVTCAGGNDGTATVNVSGGVGFYNFSWNTNPVQTGIIASGLSMGTYTVTVVDNNGCTAQETVTVNDGNNGPIADFSFNSAASSIDFINNSTGSTSWLWNFGDNSNPSNAQNPSHAYAAGGSYTVTLIAYNSCGSDTSIQVIMVTGINDQEITYTLDIYPNPTNDIFTVKFDSEQSNSFNIKLVDMQGKTIENTSLNKFNGTYQKTFDIRNFASGIYTMQIVTDKGVITKRVILNK